MNTFKLVLSLILLICLSQSQNICSNCFNTTNNNFICNNQNCQGFQYNSTQTPNANFQSIVCAGPSPVVTCYYNPSTTNTPNQNTTYLFCNYTFSQCSTCSNNQTCQSCYNGFYRYTYNAINQWTNCQSCSSAIPGCQKCNDQTQCQQCQLNYLNVNGQCYTQKGVLVSGIDPFTSGGSTAAQIVMDAFIFIILIAIIYAFCVMFVQKKFSSNSNNNNGSNNSQREPAKIADYNQQLPQRTSQMKEPHEMRRDSLNRNIVKEPVSTKNAEQYIVDTSIRDELVTDRTQRGISPN